MMMGGVSPETCWTSYKYEINFDTLWHFLGFLYELYYDARIHEYRKNASSLMPNKKQSVLTMYPQCTQYQIFIKIYKYVFDNW
jgi:hypothetical protein